MKLQVAFFLALAACLLVLSKASDEQEQQVGPRSARLPSLFDFAQFKSMFHKHYASLVEELARQKIFLGRAFRAFISMVKYRHRQISSFLRLNQMSDETPEERESRLMPVEVFYESQDVPVIEMEPDGDNPSEDQEEQRHLDANISDGAEVLPAASLEEIERELEAIESNRDKPGYHQLAEELQRLKGDMVARKRRDVSQSQPDRRASIQLEPVAPEAAGQLDAETRAKVRRRVPSNNPDYERPELASSAAGDEASDVAPPVGENVLGMLWKLPGFVGQQVSNFLASQNEAAMEAAKQAAAGDQAGVDLREHKCFFQPRDQGKCGSCWAFATVSLFEFMFCMETGELVAFSEQYMMDCGGQLEPPLRACNGGRIDASLSFVDTRGLELRLDYPYRERNDTCPYESTATEHMGHIRTLEPGFGSVKPKDFEQYLRHYKRPLLYGIKTGENFPDYGGGVDFGEGCANKTSGHAMLIVGYGREEGEDYYLFRNSHSVSWGEQGYYKFAKRALNDCVIIDRAFVSMAHFKRRADVLNPKHDRSTIRARYRSYLMKDAGMGSASRLVG